MYWLKWALFVNGRLERVYSDRITTNTKNKIASLYPYGNYEFKRVTVRIYKGKKVI